MDEKRFVVTVHFCIEENEGTRSLVNLIHLREQWSEIYTDFNKAVSRVEQLRVAAKKPGA